MANTQKKINELLVSELKKELEKRNLDTTGLKAVLVERLTNALNENGDDPEEFLFDVSETNVDDPEKDDQNKASGLEKGVGTDSWESLMKEQLTIRENVKESPSKLEIPVIEFHPEAGMIWKAWNAYFEAYCRDTNKNDFWKIRNIQRFLKGKALTLFVNHSLNLLHWEELLEIFNEEFTLPGEVSLSDFSSIKFKLGDDLIEYYHKKIQVARSLGLENKLIIQGLTDGLPQSLKQLVIVNSPTTTTEWRELVHKLTRIQSNDQSQNTYRKMTPMPETHHDFRQWRPTRPFYTNPRPGNYRFPLNAQSRFSSNNTMNQRGPRPSNVNNPPIHFQEKLPPSPCKICLGYNIPNAFHWHRNCPFRENNVSPNFTSATARNLEENNGNNNSVAQSNSGNPSLGNY